MKERIEDLQQCVSEAMRASGLLQQAIRQAKVAGVDADGVQARIQDAAERLDAAAMLLARGRQKDG